MSNYTNLKNAIQSVIKANGNNEITGPILQAELLSMITTLGAGYQYIGVAKPSTNPGTPDARVMYLAYLPGTYVNFGGLTVTGFCVLKYDTVWTKEDIPISSGGGSDFLTKPDDLTLEAIGNTNILKFADRTVGDNIQSGLNYKILREDLTFAEQVIDANTIYEIRYNFPLSANFTVPSGCELRFNGGLILGNSNTLTMTETLISGNARFLNCQIVGTVRNTELQIDWFGAIGDGSTDDSVPIENCINLAKESAAKVCFDGTKTYCFKTTKTITANNDIHIEGNGALLKISNQAILKIHNSEILSIACPHNLTRKSASITFSELPENIKPGDIIYIVSTQVGETSYNTPRKQTTRIGEIIENTIYLNDTFLFDYAAEDTTLKFYNAHRVKISNIRINCGYNSNYTHVELKFVIPIVDRVDLDGEINSYGFHIDGCVNGVFRNCSVKKITYGFLTNESSHLLYEKINCPSPFTHPIAIAAFSNFITAKWLTGVGQLIESHTGFNIAYEDCEYCGQFNIRAVGFALRRCKILSKNGQPINNPLIASVGLYDLSIYNDYDAIFEDCVIDANNIGVYHSNIIRFENCRFWENATIRFGVTSTSNVNKGIIRNCENIGVVECLRQSFELESDKKFFDAVKNANNEYEISLNMASFKSVSANGEWGGSGRINNYDLPSGTGDLVLPIKLYPQCGAGQNAGSGKLYIDFEFKFISTNIANNLTYAEKTCRARIAYFPGLNRGLLYAFEDKDPGETLLTVTLTDFAFSGSTTNPKGQVITFNLNTKTQIASFGAARNTYLYKCNVVGRNW